MDLGPGTALERTNGGRGYARTASSASSHAASPSSSSASVITSGQRTRLQFEWTPALRRSSPRTAASSATRDALDREHRAEAADVADRLEALLPGEHAGPDRVADPLRALDEALLLEH